MKRSFILAAAVLFATNALAATRADSTKRRKAIRYFFNVGVAGMAGCTDCAQTGKTVNFSASTVHGIRILNDKVGVGLGIGLDSYEKWQTLPLFGSVFWDIARGKNGAAFLQMSGGVAAARLNPGSKDYGYAGTGGGLMLNPVAGYRIKSGNLRVYFTAGYKFQRVFEFLQYPYFSYFNPPGSMSEMTQTIRYDMQRVVFGIAIGWR